MSATAVQVSPRYERTTDLRRMFTHKLLDKAIREDWEGIRSFLPAKSATSLDYKPRATKAKAWNEGEGKVSIDLPLEDGWYVPDGNPFAIPNGRKSTHEDPDALYLIRNQNSEYSGPVGRGLGYYYRRYVYAFCRLSSVSGVALIGREATAPLVAVPKEKLERIHNPKELIQRAEQLESMANDFNQRFGGMCTNEMHQKYVIEPLESAKIFRKLAVKIQEAAKV